MKRSKKAAYHEAEKPKGCRECHGRPFVSDGAGSRRCDCALGVWFIQQDRARTLAARKAAVPVEQKEIDHYE